MRRRRRATRAEQNARYGVLAPAPPLAVYEACRLRREGDEIACSTCLRRWDANEPKPPCDRARKE